MGGFVRESSSDSYVLLGGGGHKLESSLSVGYAAASASATYATSAGSVAWDNITGKPSIPDMGKYEFFIVGPNSSIQFVVPTRGGIIITCCPYYGWNMIFGVNYTETGGAAEIAGFAYNRNLYYVEVEHTSWYNIRLTTHENAPGDHNCYVYAFLAY